MKAAVYRSKQLFDLMEIPTPDPGPGEVVIKVNRSAICGTDVHAFMYDLAPQGAVLGHEFAGVISATGHGVTRWKEALDHGMAPQVYIEATHVSALEFVDLEDLQAYAVEEEA